MALISVLCPYCGAGCRLGLRVEDGQAVGVEYQTDHPIARGALCPKGNVAPEIIHHPDRLQRPLVRENGRFREADWDEALSRVVRHLSRIRQEWGADALGFLASAKATDEKNYQLSSPPPRGFATPPFPPIRGGGEVRACLRLPSPRADAGAPDRPLSPSQRRRNHGGMHRLQGRVYARPEMSALRGG